MPLSPKQLRYLWAIGAFKTTQKISRMTLKNSRPGSSPEPALKALVLRAKLGEGDSFVVRSRDGEKARVFVEFDRFDTNAPYLDFRDMSGERSFRQRETMKFWGDSLEVSGLSLEVDRRVKTARTPDEADDILESQLGNVVDQNKALSAYREFSEDVTRHMRDPSYQIADDQKEVIAGLTEYFRTAPALSSPTRVYRGVSGAFASDMIKQMASGEFQKGTRLKDSSFLSTSANPRKADQFAQGQVVLEIDLPKGTKGAFLGREYESEMLLDRDTELEVLDYHKRADGSWAVKVRKV